MGCVDKFHKILRIILKSSALDNILMILVLINTVILAM